MKQLKSEQRDEAVLAPTLDIKPGTTGGITFQDTYIELLYWMWLLLDLTYRVMLEQADRSNSGPSTPLPEYRTIDSIIDLWLV